MILTTTEDGGDDLVDVGSDIVVSWVENDSSMQHSVMAGEEWEWSLGNSWQVGMGTQDWEWAWAAWHYDGGAGCCRRYDFS
jgi:hypothetical protein